MKTPRTFKELLADPRVQDHSDERCAGIFNEGLWLYLAPGWVTDYGTTAVHEWTIKDCCECLARTSYCPDEWEAILAMENASVGLCPAGY